MKCLIFTTNIYGHFVEYIHHLCEAVAGNPDKELYVYVPSTFLEKKDLLSWSKSDNIHFDFFEESDVDKGGNLKKAFCAARVLGKKAKEIRPDSIFLLSIMQVMPFVTLFIPKGTKLSGIVYNIYLYKWKNNTIVRKIEDLMKYFIFSRCHKFRKVYILNDLASSQILNKIWHTEKFCYLPDPYPQLNLSKVADIRSEIGVSEAETLFLHFGSLTKRKGSMMVLDIISHLPEDILKKTCFVFAGKIWEDLDKEFYQKYELLKKQAHIIVFDQFCSYEFFGSLCKSSDYVILPYMNTSNSSGIISYGAQFKVPVIVPANGLVPKLVKKYKMGKVVNGNFVEEMIKVIPHLIESDIESSSVYLNGRSVSDFASTILTQL